MKSYDDIALEYEMALPLAESLPFRWHWLIGAALFLVGMVIDNPAAIAKDPSATLVGLVAFGLLGGVISEFILMRLTPGLYAKLAIRLGFAQPAA